MLSVFLTLHPEKWVVSNSLAFAIRDGYPVSPGHTLIITKREIPTWFDATREEQLAILDLIEVVKRQLDSATPRPDGYNVGFNAGLAAGQTVMHLHVHVIPRYQGDMLDPRGGVRHVIPGKGNYKRDQISPLATGGESDPFLRHLRPLFEKATEIAILAAFVQDTGLNILEPLIRQAVRRGAVLRMLTGDYLNITQAEALERLLDWMGAGPDTSDDEPTAGRLEARIVESEKLDGRTRSFHPKSWRFEGRDVAVAFVGSSNVSHAALCTGIEWNLRLDRDNDPAAYSRIAESFSALWDLGLPLDPKWVADYAERARRENAILPPSEAADPPSSVPEPHPIQQEALDALRRSREAGHRRALVVLATGLGKTWLAAFDVAAFREETGKLPRVLFLAHRRELLVQAAHTFRRLLRSKRLTAQFGWFVEDRADLDKDFVFASVSKLCRPEHRSNLIADAFDYVIVDEVHHATARSYRDILDRLDPKFLLGLTATPDRADAADVRGLFDDHEPFRADLGRGIAIGRLVPFDYYGLRDSVDYDKVNIPWRSGRFDGKVLAAKVQTQQRMEQLFVAWQEYPGERTLVFCCSVEHAKFVSEWLNGKGVKSCAVHSGPGSASRDDSLKQLQDGVIQAVCAVDIFNEGVDLPEIDRVVMLRPTESAVMFLQQLGRGLRKAQGKERLVVIDFVGNHHVFLDRVRTLLSLAERKTSLRKFIEHPDPELPIGCSIHLQAEAIDLLRLLLPPPGKDEAEQVYRDLQAARDERPTVAEMFRLGHYPKPLRPGKGSWFDFAEQNGHLDDTERYVLAASRPWLVEVEDTSMTKCFKMVLLEALIEADALLSGMPLAELASRSLAVLRRSPELFQDVELSGMDWERPDLKRWQRYWKENPVNAWTNGDFFRVEGDRLVPNLPVPSKEALPGGMTAERVIESFTAMTRELIEYRLSAYRARDVFECMVEWSGKDPILRLPRRYKQDRLPKGDTDVRLPNGKAWRFRFDKGNCATAHAVGEQRNRLPDLLRAWFGPVAGQQGSECEVRFVHGKDGWHVEPIGGKVLALPLPGLLQSYPDLRAAAGHGTGQDAEAIEPDEVRLPVDFEGQDYFAVRADGDSMDGGNEPIRDGDWLVMRLCRGDGLGAVAGKVALVQTPDDGEGHSYQVKRIVKEGSRWLLRSDNSERPSFEGTAQTVPIAVVVAVVRPESMAPPVGSVVENGGDDFLSAFQLGATPLHKSGRADGHLFLLLDESQSPVSIVSPIGAPYPGETAYVLVRQPGDSALRYLGIAHFDRDQARWILPATR